MRRVEFAMLALLTIAGGLGVHFTSYGLPAIVRDVVGDALWAMMMAWWMGFLFPRRRMCMRATTAYTICGIVELSQLLHTASLDAIRATTPGHLILGSGFDTRDLVAYLCGVIMAMALEYWVWPRATNHEAR